MYPERGESSAIGGDHDGHDSDDIVRSTETEHRSPDVQGADSQGKGGGKDGVLANSSSTGTVEQGASRSGTSGVIVLLGIEKNQRKARLMPWPQVDVFQSAPPIVPPRVTRAWVITCATNAMAEQQAESWPVMVEGCTVLRVFHRGKWHARKGVAP